MKPNNPVIDGINQQEQPEILCLLDTDKELQQETADNSGEVTTGDPQAVEPPEPEEIGTAEDEGTVDTALIVEPTDNVGEADTMAETAVEAPFLTEFIAGLRSKYADAKPLHSLAMMTPALEPESFWALVEDIGENGQQLPIILVNGQIFDGLHRELACFEAGVAPWYQEWDGTGSPAKLKASLELFRRHLTPSQRAALTVGLLHAAEEEAAQAAKFANLRKPRTRTKTKEDLAKAAGISSRTLDDALKVAKEAPDEMEKVRTGKKKVSKASSELKSPKKTKATVSDIKPKPVVAEEHQEKVSPGTEMPTPGDTRPSRQLLLSWPGLNDLLLEAEALIETPAEHLRSKLAKADPETEEWVDWYDPRYSWTPQDRAEEISRAMTYLAALKDIARQLTEQRKVVGKRIRALEAYSDRLHEDCIVPIYTVAKKQPVADKSEQDDEPPEPVDLEEA